MDLKMSIVGLQSALGPNLCLSGLDLKQPTCMHNDHAANNTNDTGFIIRDASLKVCNHFIIFTADNRDEIHRVCITCGIRRDVSEWNWVTLDAQFSLFPSVHLPVRFMCFNKQQ